MTSETTLIKKNGLPVDHFSDDEDDLPPPPDDPFLLKQQGIQAYHHGNYQSAIETWKLALKTALKKSVRFPSKDLVRLQMELRMNLALAFSKIDDHVMAKEHLLVVFDNDPNNLKVYYRLAEVYLALHDHEKALDIVNGALAQFKEDGRAMLYLKRKILLDQKEYSNESKLLFKKRVDLSQLEDERSEMQYTDGIREFDEKDFAYLLDTSIPTTSNSDESVNSLVKALIDWRHCSEKLMKSEAVTDVDDPDSSCLWVRPHTTLTLETDKSAVYLTLPFSILGAIENCLVADLKRIRCRKKLVNVQNNVIHLPPLPLLDPSITPNANLRRQAVNWTSRLARQRVRPFTIHVLGARGDAEMDARWTAIIDRLPHVDQCHVVMIGFLDTDDIYNRRLKGDEYISAPLVRTGTLRAGQKLIVHLYKGTYQTFLKSTKVTAAMKADRFKSMDILLQDGSTYALSPILSCPDHPLHPDLIVLPEPNFSRWFSEWAPAFAEILLSAIPTLLLGYSVMEGALASHEAVQFSEILPKFYARLLTPLYWNPFSLVIQPGSECPPMAIQSVKSENEVLFHGLSGKYAVAVMVCGVISEEGKEFLAKVARDEGTFVDDWRDKLANCEKMDVLRDRQNYQASKAFLEEAAKERNAQVESKANALAQSINEKLKSKPARD